MDDFRQFMFFPAVAFMIMLAVSLEKNLALGAFLGFVGLVLCPVVYFASFYLEKMVGVKELEAKAELIRVQTELKKISSAEE